MSRSARGIVNRREHPSEDKVAVQIRTATFTQERDITKARQRLIDTAPPVEQPVSTIGISRNPHKCCFLQCRKCDNMDTCDNRSQTASPSLRMS